MFAEAHPTARMTTRKRNISIFLYSHASELLSVTTAKFIQLKRKLEEHYVILKPVCNWLVLIAKTNLSIKSTDMLMEASERRFS